jgi:hypothetical protein
MGRREALFLLDEAGSLLWSDLGTAGALPDSRERWEAIWSRRNAVTAVAHSHPWGPHAFSEEDQTTMSAIDAALGRPLTYMVISPRGVLARRAGEEVAVDSEPGWARALRRASGMEENDP